MNYKSHLIAQLQYLSAMMNDELSTSFILKYRKSKSYAPKKSVSAKSPRRLSFRIKQQSQLYNKESSNQSIASSDNLQQKYDAADKAGAMSNKKHQNSKKRQKLQTDWFGALQKPEKQRTLNDMFFNLSQNVQRFLYLMNYVLNAFMRIIFIGLLIMISLQNKWVFLYIFLSLEVTATIIYFIVMIKMLFTRSDKESVQFQKKFNQAQWADIQSQRLMRTHFNMRKIVSKTCKFFNPFTKFTKNIKISFLRQQLFKRMELILVFVPFIIVFFIRQDDFVVEGYPNINVYISAGICLECIRTAITYLAVYIYN